MFDDDDEDDFKPSTISNKTTDLNNKLNVLLAEEKKKEIK